MNHGVYLRPIGLTSSYAAIELASLAGVMPLAGGFLDFSGFELIERSGIAVTRRVLGLADMAELEVGRRVMAVSDYYDALLAPRPRLGHLSLDRPRLMGIVNVTPDSFSDGGRQATTAAAIAHALRLIEEGAEIIDIGGESTRPGSDPVPLDAELARILPVLAGVRTRTRALISVDTRKAEVMRQAAAAGADLINDVSALTHDPVSLAVAAETGLPVILMHAQGDPKTMQEQPTYGDVLIDVFDFLETRIGACEAAGIPRARLIVDPGIGFGKTLGHNLTLLSGLALYHSLGVPVLVGASRKRFIGALTGVAEAADRVSGSVGAALAAAAQGAQLLRVHDVAATRQALDVWLAATIGRAPAA